MVSSRQPGSRASTIYRAPIWRIVPRPAKALLESRMSREAESKDIMQEVQQVTTQRLAAYGLFRVWMILMHPVHMYPVMCLASLDDRKRSGSEIGHVQ
jgi:hypothetical protein